MSALTWSARLYIGALTLTALAATAISLAIGAAPDARHVVLALALACATAGAFLYPLPFAFKTKLHLDMAVTVACVLLFPPGVAMLAVAAGALAAYSSRRRDLAETLFNSAQATLQAGAGALVLAAAGWSGDAQHLDNLLYLPVIVLAGVATQMTSTLAVATIVGLQSGVSPLRVWYRTTIQFDRVEILSLLSQLGLGTLAAVIATAHLWALPLLLLPALVVFASVNRHSERRLEAEAGLAEAQRIARLGSWDWNMDTGEELWSEEVFRIYGFEPRGVDPTHQLFLESVHPEDREYVRRSMDHAIRERVPLSIDHRIVLPDGAERAVHQEGGVIPDEHDRAVRMVGTVHDITERKALEGRLAHQAFHDTLTGLPNRTRFAERLAAALARTDRRSGAVAVCFLDLDRFKAVNDTLGHDAGDLLLVAVAGRLRECLRPEDLVARLGGDEFTVLMQDVSDPAEVTRLALRIIEAIERPFELEGQEVSVGTSIGIALGTPGQAGPDDLLRDADAAMYEAKRAGEGRYEVFDGSTGPSDQLQLVEDLRRAVDRGELLLEYLPTVDVRTERIVGMEALVRWRHPTRGLLNPAELIPLAEETGLILPIGGWVLREACAQASEWRELYPYAPPTVGVNLSARQLAHPDLVEDVRRVLRETHLPPDLLEIEITEGIAIDDGERHADAIERLRGMGVRVAIDGFGTGYGSLTHLKRRRVDALKIDRGFTSGLGANAEDTAIVESLIRLARALGMEVVAEGVESRDQLERLRSLGCGLAQGYLLHRPMPAHLASALLAEDRIHAHAPAALAV